MSDVINLLPDSIANQIAAGEVVQRPASVVKELLENSIDAHSSHIRLLVFEGGKNGIQVIDNGIGMSPLDANLCFERHATSKIRQAADLETIVTMGFRGEALASIAAVAEVTLITKRGEDEFGTKISISGSRVVEKSPVACATGANFSVRNIFFNVPARRRFLKSTAVEMRHVVNEFLRVALANPDVEMMLFHQQSTVYKLPSASLQQRIIQLYGKDLAPALLPIDIDSETISIHGFLIDPLRLKKRFSEQFLFVNNRYMRSPYFNKAITSAYERLLPPEVLPSFFLYFTIDPKNIDVNIHPTKTEVKFQNEQIIWEILFAGVRKTLGRSSGLVNNINIQGETTIRVASPSPTTTTSQLRDTTNSKTNVIQGKNPFLTSRERQVLTTSPVQVEEARKEDALLNYTSLRSYSTLPIANSYFLANLDDELRIVDQHRAHARVLYERYMQDHLPTPQTLLVPARLTLIPSQKVGIETFVEKLLALGVDITLDAERNLVLKSHFPTVPPQDPSRFLEKLFQEYSEKGDATLDSVTDAPRRAMAFALAYRYNEPLTAAQREGLFRELLTCSEPMLDPKRRPTMRVFSLADIERLLK